MTFIKNTFQRTQSLGAAATLVLAAIIPAISLSANSSAAALTNRGLTVTSTVAGDDMTAPDGSTYSSLPDNDPRNGQRVGHTYTFTKTSTDPIKGFTIEYCDAAFGYIGDGACSDTLHANNFAANWTGPVTINGESFTVTKNADNFLTFTTTGTGISDPTITIDLQAGGLNYFKNPDAAYKYEDAKGTYFAHISTFGSDTDAAAAYAHASPDPLNPEDPAGILDDGTVTNNVTAAIGIYTRVQETLNFSVEGDGGVGDLTAGATPPNWNSGTCDPLKESGQLKMGDSNHALSFEQSYHAKSYFRLSTNSSNGVGVYYAGDTLKSNTHTMHALGDSQVQSEAGEEQFGMAFDLTDNLNGNVGIGSALIPVGAYENSQNGYAFDATNPTQTKLLASANGVVACDTGALEYVANIAPETPSGIYQTKINYIAAPKY